MSLEDARSSRFHDTQSRSSDTNLSNIHKYNRTPYEHDYDRILYSSYLRRLASVTQIFNPSEGVIFHNRLTHTIKVAQIATRLAQRVRESDLSENDLENVGGLNKDVVSAAALAHDIGNPPFGHAAESVLDAIIREEENIKDGFEGNAQSFRIVTTLEAHNENYPGLNLTRATLNSMLKYPWKRKNKKQNKFGCYSSELKYFKFARELTPNLHNRKSLEASIMDISDDISYGIHDLLDLMRQGLIPFSQLRENSEQLSTHGEDPFRTERNYPKFAMLFELIDTLAKNDYHEEWAPDWINDRNNIIAKVRSFFNRLYLLIPDTSYSGYKREKVYLKDLEDYFISSFLDNIEINCHPQNDEPVLFLKDKAADELIILKAIAKSYIVNSQSLIKQQCGEKKIICEIFYAYKQAIDDKDLRIILPAKAREELIILKINESTENTRFSKTAGIFFPLGQCFQC